MRSAAVMLAAVSLLAACDVESTRPDPQFDWITILEARPGWEGIAGEAAVNWTEGALAFSAAAVITGDEPGAVRPWHVHHNTCAEGGGIVGADGDYPRLTVGATGTASAVAQVPTGLTPNAAYHVNVHLSAAEMATIIACGDLISITP